MFMQYLNQFLNFSLLVCNTQTTLLQLYNRLLYYRVKITDERLINDATISCTSLNQESIHLHAKVTCEQWQVIVISK